MTKMYPEIKISHNKKPNRLYAIPLFGFLVKLFMIIPVGIELAVLQLVLFLISIFNSLNIFFKGVYWKNAYDLNLGIMKLQANVTFFLWGLTDTYPRFSFATTNYDLSLGYNKKPNRLLATPLLGMLFRFILLFPYGIYRQVISLAAFFAIVVSWIPVLCNGKYPETTYEIVRDSVRIDLASFAYYLGMSDSYPSWWISLNHKTLKIILIVLAAISILLSWNWNAGSNWQKSQKKLQKNYYMNTVQSTPHYTY